MNVFKYCLYLLICLGIFYRPSRVSIDFFDNHIDSSVYLTNEEIFKYIQNKIAHSSDFPEFVDYKNKRYEIKYTIDSGLQRFVDQLLRSYRSDFAAVVIVHNESGSILASSTYSRSTDQKHNDVLFQADHPSASLFKIITAAHLIENAEFEIDSSIPMFGRATTLYKSQLSTKRRYGRSTVDLKSAFAKSHNSFFGKAAILTTDTKVVVQNENSQKLKIMQMAKKMGFDRNLMIDMPLDKSVLMVPGESYELAELASGYNTQTKVTPFHAAILSSIVANDGFLRPLHVITEIIDTSSQDRIYRLTHKGIPRKKRALSLESARKLQDVMEYTIVRGTASSAFRGAKKEVLRNNRIGGKTGSITGGNPYGKRDWFSSYMIPIGRPELGISVVVMNVNIHHWYVRSSYLARRIYEFYYEEYVKKNKFKG